MTATSNSYPEEARVHLDELVKSIRLLLDLAATNSLSSIHETPEQALVELEFSNEYGRLTSILSNLASILALARITCVLQIDGNELRTQLVDRDLLRVIDCSGVHVSRLCRVGQRVAVEEVHRWLNAALQEARNIAVRLNIFLNKGAIAKDIPHDPEAHFTVYMRADNWLMNVTSDLGSLDDALGTKHNAGALVLVGDLQGAICSDFLCILGIDQWKVSRIADYHLNHSSSEQLVSLLRLRDTHCKWMLAGSSRISPLHFNVMASSSHNSRNEKNLVGCLHHLRDMFSLAYLASSAEVTNQDKLKLSFTQLITLELSTFSLNESKSYVPGLFELFLWAYQESQSLGIEIVKNLIPKQLEGRSPESYLVILQESAENLIRVARRNLKLALRDDFKEYFDNRAKLLEALSKLSNDVNESIAKLAEYLGGDILKTGGVIISAAITALLDRDLFFLVGGIVAVAYLVYLTTILCYVMTAAYFRYAHRFKYYRHLRDSIELELLGVAEVKQIEDNIPLAARRLFLLHFIPAMLIYAILWTINLQIVLFCLTLC